VLLLFLKHCLQDQLLLLRHPAHLLQLLLHLMLMLQGPLAFHPLAGRIAQGRA
jgi:hypothetical protein